MLSLFGPADGPPGVPGVQIADVGGGALPAATAVMAALLERGQTGRGRHLDLSLCRGAMAFAAVAFPTHLAGATEPRGQGMLTGGVPCYRCYRTADDRFVAVGALEPQFFSALCTGLGRPDLATQGYAQGVEGVQVAAELQAVFSTATRDEWVARFEGIDACLSPVLSPGEALERAENASVHGTDGRFMCSRPREGMGRRWWRARRRLLGREASRPPEPGESRQRSSMRRWSKERCESPRRPLDPQSAQTGRYARPV